MKNIPPEFIRFGHTSIFTQYTLPQSFREPHRTKAGVWAQIFVMTGQVRYVIHSRPEEAILLGPNIPGVIEPEVSHHMEPLGVMEIYVELYRRP
jgi:tellurite methyltransferase